MKLIPEYEPVQKLCLSFVHPFFNIRFEYGKTLCEIINAVQHYVAVEVWVSPADRPFFQQACDTHQTTLENVTLNRDSPGRGVIAEYGPIFAEGEKGEGIGLVFQHPFLDNSVALKRFSERLTARLGFRPLDIGFEFATAHLLVNEDLVLLSDCFFKGQDRQAKLEFLADHFPTQSFHVVPSVTGDITKDLDMYLWPIAPKAWIVSEFPAHTPQAESIAPALQVLKEHRHTVHPVPGLEPIIYDDINTLSNYANGVIVNQAALAPVYQREEDQVVLGILEDCGYQVFPIDCSQVILSNSGLHCISKTVPAKSDNQRNTK